MDTPLLNLLTYYPDFYAVLHSTLQECGSAFSSYNVTVPHKMTSMYTASPSTASPFLVLSNHRTVPIRFVRIIPHRESCDTRSSAAFFMHS
ncbi:hypothetical protein C8R44DRAFT_890635 [Mycena epipterygia]|nr:hypothetical protein C8R44DRAFT_890635 [Mycena epipterygia]